MRMTRRERKAFNLGKQVGYSEGYARGFHDGNPFNAIIEAISNMADTIADAMKKDPQLAEEIKWAQEHPEFMNLEIVENEDGAEGGPNEE